MLTRKFFVAHRDQTSTLAQMAELFNRINANGKQVQTEERAFAALVGLQKDGAEVADGLRRTFAAVHGEFGRQADRDALLRRQEERAFGFKLFVRVFLQVCGFPPGIQRRQTELLV